MIPTHKFARLSRKRQVRWLLYGLSELEALMPEPARLAAFYSDYLEGLVADQLSMNTGLGLRLRQALQMQWWRWCASLGREMNPKVQGELGAGPNIGDASRCELRELEELLKQLCGLEPCDWDIQSARDAEVCERPEILSKPIQPYLGLYLDRVRSPFNIGSIFRSAAAFGVSEIWLHSHCPDLEHPRAQRTAMGCIGLLAARRCDLPQREPELSALPWLALETPDLVAQYQDQSTGLRIGDWSFPAGGGLLLVGAEESGLRLELLEYCASTENHRRGGGLVSIPMPGSKQSLNLAVAAAIAMQHWSARLYQ